MGLFGGNYLISLIVAFCVVTIIPYFLSKMILSWIKTFERQDRKKDLSTLIRREVVRLRSTTRPSSTTTAGWHSQGRPDDKVVSFYRSLSKSLQKREQINDLEESIQLFEAAIHNKPTLFQNLSSHIDRISKSQIPIRDIIHTTRTCLLERAFILSEENRQVMTNREVKNLICAKTIMQAFIQDARLESSTICQSIERGKNKRPEQVYLAIRLLVLLKSGATQKALYQMAIEQPNMLKARWEQLNEAQINRAIFSLLRQEKGRYLPADQIPQLIYQKICEFEQFQREFIQKKSKEQEEKRKRSRAKRAAPTGNLVEAYETLGCHQSDSTSFIKKSYRKLALKNHPDRVSHSAAPKAHEDFVKIQEAYDHIVKSRKKAA